MATFVCDECGFLSLGYISASAHGPAHEVKHLMEQPRSEAITWVPNRPTGKVYRHVPHHIAEAAQEAHRCFSIDAHRAAVLLARSVIEATAKQKEVTKGNLQQKIDLLFEAGHIRALVRDQAHEIRYLGNEMAHGDFTNPVSKEESSEIVELMDELLTEVYEAPARLEARRKARLAKQQEAKDASGNN